MRIGINASYLRKIDSGIGQVTRCFLRELARSARNDDEFILYLEENTDLKLAKNFQKKIKLPWFYRRDDLIRKVLWEKYIVPREAKRDGCEKFISLYQCPTQLKEIEHTMLVHDMVWKVFPRYLDNWRKKVYARLTYAGIRNANQVITISEWSKKDIHKYLKIQLSRIKVAYDCIDDIFYQERNEIEDNQILEKYGIFGRYVFYVGGFDFRKNVDTLIRAFKLFLARNPDEKIKLVLAGEDRSHFSEPFTDVKQEIKKNELEDHALSIGFVEQADLPALYRNSDFFILPTLYEGFGLMALEAMASGAPTAVSKSSSLPEVGGNAVLYFNPYDEEEMARVMGKLARNVKLRRNLSEKGRTRAKKFNWQDFIKVFFNE